MDTHEDEEEEQELTQEYVIRWSPNTNSDSLDLEKKMNARIALVKAANDIDDLLESNKTLYPKILKCSWECLCKGCVFKGEGVLLKKHLRPRGAGLCLKVFLKGSLGGGCT